MICLRNDIYVILLSFHPLSEENPAEVQSQMLKAPYMQITSKAHGAYPSIHAMIW